MGRSTVLAAGAASAAALCIAPAFVPAVSSGNVNGQPTALRGAGAAPAEQSTISMTTVAGAAVLLAGIGSAAGRRVTVVARKAEPISATAAAAAAAAAAKTAGAAGAAKAASVAAGAKAAAGSTAVGAGTGKSLSGEKESTGGNPKFDPTKQVGVTAPLGYFDPAGFSKQGDEAGFRNLRAAELKHGRAAMMAALGAVVQHYVKFPGFDAVPAGLDAVTTAPGTYGFAGLFALSGVLELAIWTEDAGKEPGNFGDPVGFGQYTEEMRNRELNNGRFAMFAAMGIIAADLLSDKDAIEQLGIS